MSHEQKPDTTRSRFGNVVNRADVAEEHWGHDSGRYGANVREIALSMTATDLGFSVVSLEPGKRSCPFHFHHSEEELFIVLEGRGILRQGDADGEEERIELRGGDFVSFPAGTGIAHQFLNESDAPFVYIALSNRLKHDVCEYPDSDKVLIRGKRMMLRRKPNLEYFDGEV